MDELVLQAMRKWPQVPACWGWLGLDARGQWRMRDDAAQAAGTFQSQKPHAKGDPVLHARLQAFIGRNYTCDAAGLWYFQNGPQRVYVELAHTPWIWRMQPDGQIYSHTGQVTQVRAALTDEQGLLYLDTPLGLGLVHTQDVALAVDWLAAQAMEIAACVQAELPNAHGFVQSPSAVQSAQSG